MVAQTSYRVTPTWDWIELNWVGSWVGGGAVGEGGEEKESSSLQPLPSS